MDLSQHINLEENFNNQIEYLTRAQIGTPFDLVPFIVENFKDHRLFHSVNHPGKLIMEQISNNLLPLLGCDEKISVDHELLDFEQTVVHPSIIAYYQLNWCTHDTLWRYTTGKNETFQEYLKIYVESKLSYSSYETKE